MDVFPMWVRIVLTFVAFAAIYSPAIVALVLLSRPNPNRSNKQD